MPAKWSKMFICAPLHRSIYPGYKDDDQKKQNRRREIKHFRKCGANICRTLDNRSDRNAREPKPRLLTTKRIVDNRNAGIAT